MVKPEPKAPDPKPSTLHPSPDPCCGSWLSWLILTPYTLHLPQAGRGHIGREALTEVSAGWVEYSKGWQGWDEAGWGGSKIRGLMQWDPES